MKLEQQLLIALDQLTEGTVTAKKLPPGFRTVAFVAEAVATHKTHRSWVLGHGIQGLGIAERTTNGKRLKELALKVYVDVKKPVSKLKGSTKVPKEVKVAGLEMPILTDVEAIGVVRPESNTARVRPAIPGFSIGHVDVSAGTFGCLVRKKGGAETLYVLSNSHVLANQGLGSPGDAVIQQARADGGSVPDDLIATLAEFVPFEFTETGFPNLVDAAIAKVKRDQDVTSAIRIIGVPAGVSTTLRRGMQVQKTGRTTDYTIGLIQDINYRANMTYKMSDGGTGRAGLADQVLCSRYTAPGDSGSAVLDMQRRIVGLHFAGSDSSSIFNKISNVLAALNIEVVTRMI
jgi:hypothetical protein